ncbi:MAG TPA: CheR family methyltransferase, partial [Blastocatellia bacterium]|nr:CheR family methyltransferase [Blastocatellia bacterium]
TIAMALNEEGWFDRAHIEIYASDASRAAIEKARRGVYRERSFRSLPPQLREKYFSQGQGGSRVAPDLHARIKWATANLMDDAEVATFAAAPVIFCRNVFIYFSDDAIRKTVRLFAERMPAPGYLFVAAAESLLRMTTQFQFQEIGGAFVYVKC